MSDFDSADLHDLKELLNKEFEEYSVSLISIGLGNDSGLDTQEFFALATVTGYINSNLIWLYIRGLLRLFLLTNCSIPDGYKLDLDVIRHEDNSNIEKSDEMTIHDQNIRFAFRVSKDHIWDVLSRADEIPAGFFDASNVDRVELL